MRNLQLNSKILFTIIAVLITLIMAILVCFVCISPASAFTTFTNDIITDARNDSFTTDKIKTYECEYKNINFVSLRDMAKFYKNSEKEYNLEITEDTIKITDGTYIPVGSENKTFAELNIQQSEPWLEQEAISNKMFYNGNKVKYSSMIQKIDANNYDCWININDAILLFDRKIDIENGGFIIHENTANTYDKEVIQSLNLDGACSSCLCGEVNSQSILYSINENSPVSIASTSKLMTLFVIMDLIDSGQLSYDDKCTMSKNVEKLSIGDDGTMPVKEGQEVTVDELLYLMMVPSSNEAAICLAEHVCECEDCFVECMNNKAHELRLKHTRFWTSSGVPYSETKLPNSKVQNYSSAKDMFYLSCELVKQHPDVIKYTSTKEYDSPTFNENFDNVNRLLYNLDDCVGLKTGSTNRADDCLIALSENKDGKQVITLGFGFDNISRTSIACTYLYKYAENIFINNQGADLGDNIKMFMANITRFFERL